MHIIEIVKMTSVRKITISFSVKVAHFRFILSRQRHMPESIVMLYAKIPTLDQRIFHLNGVPLFSVGSQVTFKQKRFKRKYKYLGLRIFAAAEGETERKKQVTFNFCSICHKIPWNAFGCATKTQIVSK